MKTALITTCWLGNQEYVDRMNKWLAYYEGDITKHLHYDDIILLDNSSSFSSLKALPKTHKPLLIQRFTPFYDRPSHYDYKYFWRAIDFFEELFKEYDKLIYIETDFFILSAKLANHVNQLDNCWWTPYCPKYGFLESALQVITKDSVAYAKGHPFTRYNGQCAENVLPAQPAKNWVGDRYPEGGILMQDYSWDFCAQVPSTMQMTYNLIKA